MMETIDFNKRSSMLRAFCFKVDDMRFEILDTEGTDVVYVNGMDEDYVHAPIIKIDGSYGKTFLFNPKQLTIKDLFIGFHELEDKPQRENGNG